MRAIFTVALFLPLAALSQVGIGTTGIENASAKLEVKSTTQGFLPPRMTTTQRDAISSPADGLVIYNTTNNRLEIRSATANAWLTLVTLAGSETLTGKTIDGSSNTITNVSLTAGVTGALPIANGGTGQTTANAALNALLPSQTGNADKVLVTNGTNTSWNTNVALTSARIGTMFNGSQNTSANACTGASIDLPPGKWSVSVSMLGATNSVGDFWVQTGFSASTSTISLGADAVSGGPVLVSGLVKGQYNNMITGTVIINNTSGANKTYYYCTASVGPVSTPITMINLGTNQYGENTIIAYPMN